jgi:DNA-binding transcriptional ArsR family regulator
LKARGKDTFAAVADPTRRSILDALRDEGPLTSGELASRFPAISRAAVSKHLGILRRAKLVRSRARGREAVYRLEAGPLAELYGGWLATFLPVMEDSLAELKRRAESG